MMLAALIYAIVSLAVGCAYVGFFREFNETRIETLFRAAAIGLAWPLLAIGLAMLILWPK